jgi:hypothetical protein
LAVAQKLHKDGNFKAAETHLFHQDLGEWLSKCINLRECGKKLLNAQSYMEKISILANWQKMG